MSRQNKYSNQHCRFSPKERKIQGNNGDLKTSRSIQIKVIICHFWENGNPNIHRYNFYKRQAYYTTTLHAVKFPMQRNLPKAFRDGVLKSRFDYPLSSPNQQKYNSSRV